MLLKYWTLRQVWIASYTTVNIESLSFKLKGIFPILISQNTFSSTQKARLFLTSSMESEKTVNLVSENLDSQITDNSLPSTFVESADALKKENDKLKSSTAAHCLKQLDKPVSKKALKRQARAQQYKQLIKRRKAENLMKTGRSEAGFNVEEFDQTSYYFENGLRKVYPYPYVFATYAKGRWVGRTLKNVLEKEFGFDYPEDVDKAFHQGKIHVNNVLAGIDYVVKDGDYISHQIHRHENPVTETPLEIIADTDEVVVINKPSSIPCHPCGRYRYNSVVFILGKEMGYSNLRNIYRLDRLTSGVLMMGKTAATTKKLEDQVLNRQVQKEYVCRVIGEFPSETITVDQPLAALSNKLRLQIVSPSGKSSQTTFTRLSYNGQTSVVKCEPRTGRTHQIRVHLQYLGHPIINDVFYNSDAWGPNKGKGGIYEIPNDTVCELIMRKHQATQWEGGENPLFHQKLNEMEKQKRHHDLNNSHISKDSEPKLTIENDNSTKTEDSNVNTNNSCILKPAESITSNNDNMNETELNNSDILLSELSSKHVTNEKANESQLMEVVSESNVDDDIKNNPDLLCTSQVPNTETQSAFDWIKWQVDASCDLCRKLTIDPKPRDLVMFLHAWKYKGPGWEYETEMPNWAQADWHQEDDFVLESTTGRQSQVDLSSHPSDTS